MTSSETSSQQQQQQHQMHMQCVQAPGTLLTAAASLQHLQHQHAVIAAAAAAASHPDNNNTPPIIATIGKANIDGVAVVNHLPPQHHQHHHQAIINHDSSSSSTNTGSLTTSNGSGIAIASASPSSSLSVTSSSQTSSAYLSCCSTLSLANGAGGGGSSLKISDNHLSTKLLRNSSAPYSVIGGGGGGGGISRNNNNKSVVGDEQSDKSMSSVATTTASQQVNGGGGGGGVEMVKLEPNGNTIEINSNSANVTNAMQYQHQLHHLQQNGGGGGCCHHTAAAVVVAGIPTPTSNGPIMNHSSFGGGIPNGMVENCDLNNGHAASGSSGVVASEMMMDTSSSAGGTCHNNNSIIGNINNNNNAGGQQNQCISSNSHLHNNSSPSSGNNNTLVSSSIHPGSVVTLVASPSSSASSTTSPCNNNNNNSSSNTAVPTTTATNNNNMIIMVNGGVNGGNNLSPGENEDDDEHDCDDDKVINGDTFGAAGELPDPDSIKMFVGQIPKHMNETDLRELFEKYGRVYQINVLRDKANKQSKGCCFVTFFTRKAALDAQNALHNVKTLPGMNNTVQMKPADNENRYDRKLFIGMISKKLSETDVRNMFSRFGTIDDCTVLRLPTGDSRGCAFVTFSTKQSAQNAIKAVHQSITMEGCSSPIVVKFADTPKDKDQKRQSQMVSNPANLLSTLSSSTINPVQQQYYSAILHHQLQQQQQPTSQSGFFPQLSPLGVQGLTGIGGLGSTSATGLPALSSAHLSATTNADLATLTGLLSGVTQTPHSLTVQNLHTLAALGNSSLSPTVSSINSSEYTGASGSSVGSGNSVANLTGNGLQSGLTSYHGLRTTAVNTKQAEGPEGCNLFIYHLPPECGDAELAQMFIDKQTNLSKCFGFVSFDNQLSAQMAIQAMNGFQVGVKRLKVQLKRSKSKDAAKPY